jgi:hypothetical protein
MTASKILALVFTVLAAMPLAAAPPSTSSQRLKEPLARPLVLRAARNAGQFGNAVGTINRATMRRPGAAMPIDGTSIRPRWAPALMQGASVRRPKS